MTVGVGTKLGPVQLIAIGFGPAADFAGKVNQELGRLEESGTIRLLDLLFVRRDAESGDLLVLEDQSEHLGGIMGALLGFEFDGDEMPAAPDLESVDGAPFGLDGAQIVGLADGIEPGHAAAFMLFEEAWARDLKNAIRRAGGLPLGEGLLTPDAIAIAAAEIVAMVEELDQLESEAEDA